jgi:hypothetical protein
MQVMPVYQAFLARSSATDSSATEQSARNGFIIEGFMRSEMIAPVTSQRSGSA